MPATLQKTIKPIYVTFLLCINLSMVNAQNISVLSGISLPVQFYGSKDVSLKDAGFANNGFCTSIRFEDNRKMKPISFISQITHNYNSIDELALEKFANSDPGVKSKVNIQAVNPWQQLFIGLGPKATFNSEKFSLHTNALVGINWLFSAAYNRFDTATFYKQKRLNASSLGVIFGFGSNITLTNNLFLSLNADYYYTNANYGNIVLTDQNGNVLALANPQKLEVPVQTFLVQLGLTFNLRNNSKNFLKN